MTSNGYTALKDAVLALCTDTGLVARLEHAHIALARIDAEADLPESLRFRFEELLADIAYGADAVADALVRMSAPDRERLASRVVGLFDEALRLMPTDA
ncbi:hypothetical protein GCM10008101_09020 [Lysobacter xinjiangensis]|uniref:Uncharacterized protein n=1 Tax=Cognatilysobacter xinjiangensis TaxID=546892 RepID=A0ABQ3BU34_9GAMM|nr:hypothetical protein [Lysobacter xinjiangensis]GGZ57621.1 hypothetical protein GCM10008101_09020 [Lysobacter xinjiangensis]